MFDSLRHTDPVKMTLRARLYLGIATSRNLIVGLAYMFLPAAYMSSPAYDQIKAIAPLHVWAVMFLAAGILCAVAAITTSEKLARLGLAVSVVVGMTWAGGLLAATLSGSLQGPVGVVIWLAVALKDMVMCAGPMRSPFEPLIRRTLARNDSDGG